MTEDIPPLYHPKPRRTYDLTPSSTNSSTPPLSRQPSTSSRNDPDSFAEKASRNRSILNLTSSTLFGIYKPAASGFETNRSEPSTPSGNGSQTPGGTNLDDRPPIIGPYVKVPPRTTDVHPHPHQLGFWGKSALLAERIVLLFFCGMAYGMIVSRLRDNQQVVPVRFDLRGVRHHSWGYLIMWGSLGVVFGAFLPWVDVLWEEVLGYSKDVFPTNGPSQRPASLSSGDDKEARPAAGSGSGLGADWNPAVRSIGAFIGIAFAIVCCPFDNTTGTEAKLTPHSTAQTTMAINLPSLPNPCPRQPRPLVPRRPLETRLPPIHLRWPCRYSHCRRYQPRNRTLTGRAIASGRHYLKFHTRVWCA